MKNKLENLRNEATKLLKKREFQFRSCWKCNRCHEHLKKAGLICCFVCSHWYLNGVDITITKKHETETNKNTIKKTKNKSKIIKNK